MKRKRKKLRLKNISMRRREKNGRSGKRERKKFSNSNFLSDFLLINSLARKVWSNRRKISQLSSVIRKKSPNIFISCPKRISLVKLNILTPLQNLPKMHWWFGQNNCCPGLWKVAQSIKNRPIWPHSNSAKHKHTCFKSLFLFEIAFCDIPKHIKMKTTLHTF